MPYSLDWLLEKYEAGHPLKYIFFWGHTSPSPAIIGKHCFSQWFEAPFTVEGVTYKTTEHYMMAQKARLFQEEEMYQRILQCKTPGEAKELGRQVRHFDQKLWEENRYEIVCTGNEHKFSQHPALKEFLLKTSPRVLVEASPLDTVWGIGLDQKHPHLENPYHWQGLNLLGFALMEVRDTLALQ